MQHYYASDESEEYKGECKCGKKGTYRPDPYTLEIHGKKVMKWLCDNCYRERCEDI